MVDGTWDQAAMPILQYVVECGAVGEVMKVRDMADVLGLAPEDIVTEVERLIRAGFLVGTVQKSLGRRVPSVGARSRS